MNKLLLLNSINRKYNIEIRILLVLNSILKQCDMSLKTMIFLVPGGTFFVWLTRSATSFWRILETRAEYSSNMCLMRCCHHFPKHMVSNFGVEYSWLTHKLPPEANIFRYTYLDRQRNDHLVFHITSSVFGWATSILSIVSLSNGGTLEDFS